MKEDIQKILDKNFTKGDNAKALEELCVLFNVVQQKGQYSNFNCKVCGRTIGEMGKMTSTCGVSACPN